MKTYTFEVVITEGNDEWWEEINKTSKSFGVDELKKDIEMLLNDNGLTAEVTIKQFLLNV